MNLKEPEKESTSLFINANFIKKNPKNTIKKHLLIPKTVLKKEGGFYTLSLSKLDRFL
jgi:hypothetical protein